MKSLKFLQKPEMLLLLVGIAALIILVVMHFSKSKEQKEGFYPLNAARAVLGDKAMRRYNDFADTQDMEKVNVIPEMEAGDKMLNALLDTPSYEPDANKIKQGPAQGIRYDDERKYRALPEPPELLRRIKLCEKVKGWQCEAISDPEFYKYCGICTKDGKDHLGYDHEGGMYIDPDRRKQAEDTFARTGKRADLAPTFGICKGEYILERPYCDIQKDRYECSVATTLTDKNTASKCGFCVNGGGYVYIGDRGNKAEGYKLKGAPVKHNVRLRLAVTHPEEAVIEVKRVSTNTVLPGAFIKGSCVYLVDVPNAIENEEVSVKIKYPEYKDYEFSAEDLKRIKEKVNPPKAALARAAYGPHINDYTTDDPRAVDVTRYVQDKFKIYDCSKMNVMASNDGLGGDPTYGMYKQLRLAYSDDGVNFAYAYAGEGQVSQPVQTDNLRTLCPVGQPQADAEREVCEIIAGSDTPSGRTYTTTPNRYYGASGKSKCILDTTKKPRGVLGMWESPQKTIRTVPVDLSVKTLNGLKVGADGLPKYGTAKNSREFKQITPLSKLPGIPEFLFWFWGKNSKEDTCEFTLGVPAFFRDPTILEDLRLCPGGPISTTPEGSTRLQAGVCEKLINSKPQAPGTYTDDCLRSLFIAGGCTKEGKAYPMSQEKLNAFKKDPTTGEFLDADTMIANVRDYIFVPASTGLDVNGNTVDADGYAQANIDCFGKVVDSVCDTAFKDTGPHTPACLDYLFRNAGKDNPAIGPTYNNYNRSSGSDRLPTTPILYCQRTGSLSPIKADGTLNLTAIQQANEKGSVANVRDFYRQIHYDANFNTDRAQQKDHLDKCYGVNVVDAAKPCPPPSAPPPFTCAAKLLPKNPKIFPNNKIGFIQGTTGNYKLSFDLTPRSVNGGWGSILHFSSTGGNCCGNGERSPAIWTIPGTTRLHVRIGDNNDGNWGIDTDAIPLNKRTTVTLHCQEKKVELTVGKNVYKLDQPTRRYAGNLHVWAGDPWYEAFNGSIDNLCYEIIPKQMPNTGSYEYKGNFKDAGGRPLPMRVANVQSAEDCYKQAVQKGQNMFGLQYYGECWLGNNAPYDRDGKFDGDPGELGVAYMNRVWVSPQNPPK